jgi:DNA-binding transcriptional MerR regulator
MTETTQVWRTKKVLERIMELRNMGLSDEEIASQLNSENKSHTKRPITATMVKRIESTQIIRHREFLQTDEDYATLYKDTLLKLINEGRENLKIIKETRQQILDKLELIKKEIPDVKLMEYMREISNAVKTQNDTIRTLNNSLERLETQQKEIKVNQVQSIRQTLQSLKSLEQQGFIRINPEFSIGDLQETER